MAALHGPLAGVDVTSLLMSLTHLWKAWAGLTMEKQELRELLVSLNRAEQAVYSLVSFMAVNDSAVFVPVHLQHKSCNIHADTTLRTHSAHSANIASTNKYQLYSSHVLTIVTLILVQIVLLQFLGL